MRFRKFVIDGPLAFAAEEYSMIDFARPRARSGGGGLRYVALVIETSHGCGRALLKGISRYTREHRAWSICFEPHGKSDIPPAWLRHWRGDGLLIQLRNRRFADLVRKLGVPAVDVRGDVRVEGVPFVGVDGEAAARAAFEHMRERGMRQFAYCGLAPGEDGLMDQREIGRAHV